jgi:endonuclease YncB( thermonuclease family)
LRLALKTVDRSGQCPARIVHVSRRPSGFPERVQPYRPNFLRRTISRYQLVELFVIIGIILMVWGALSLGRVTSALKQAPSGWLDSVRIEILDSDSIRSGRQLYRLVGFNTPESGDNAACERERILAAEATRRLRQLVAGAELDLRRVPCACPRGTEGTGQCNYGRLCGTLTVRGQDVGTILIAEGLAERYVCGPTSCPPRKSWCSL